MQLLHQNLCFKWNDLKTCCLILLQDTTAPYDHAGKVLRGVILQIGDHLLNYGVPFKGDPVVEQRPPT